MAIIKPTALTLIATVLSTEMNGLLNGSTSNVGPTIDLTSTNRYSKYLLEWDNSNTFGGSPSSGGAIIVYRVLALDGTNFSLASSSILASDNNRIATLLLAAVTNAGQKVPSPGIDGTIMVPAICKFGIRNLSGQSLPGTGNVLRLYGYNIESV